MKQGDYSLSARKGLPGFYSVCYKKRATGYTVRKETTARGHLFAIQIGEKVVDYRNGLILALDRVVNWLEAERLASNPCEWFLLCENPATMTRAHLILGEIPICERCNDKVERLSE